LTRDPITTAIAAARSAAASPLYLVRGDRPLAEPAAHRLAAALGELWGAVPSTLRHPDDLAEVVADLRTYSLFDDGKVVVAVATGVLAERSAAAELVADARSALPFAGGAEELVGRARDAALALLRVLRLFDVEPAAGPPDRVLARLPDALFAAGRGRARRASEGADPRAELEPLLAAAVAAGLRGLGETEASLLADLVSDGLPDKHALILVEGSAADEHPLVAALARRGALLDAGRLTAARGGRIDGLERLVVELERETGAAIGRDAAAALAHRTLRAEGRRGAAGEIDPDSTERFGAEYRKLAALVSGRSIEVADVEAHVEDRGEEDVWQVLDAVAAGRPGEALARLERRLAGAEDPAAERLAVFALLAAFARQVVAVRGVARAAGLQAGEKSYPRFKSELAPRLQGEVEGLAKNPLAGLHPFRLHRAYLAAGRFDEATSERLPADVLEAERRLKGDSGEAGAALADLLLRLAAAPAGGSGTAPSSQVRRSHR
jgi:DNA polymerase III delta subunit